MGMVSSATATTLVPLQAGDTTVYLSLGSFVTQRTKKKARPLFVVKLVVPPDSEVKKRLLFSVTENNEPENVHKLVAVTTELLFLILF